MAKAAVAEKEPRSKAELSPNEILTLQALQKGNKPMTRKDLRAKTGIKKGWSRMLGATTKDNLGARGKDSLIGRKLIKHDKHEGDRNFVYTITATGKQTLARVLKAQS